jgi:hypothetical protein
MNEKQRMLWRLCSQILDIGEPNAQQPLNEKTFAFFWLKQAAALV